MSRPLKRVRSSIYGFVNRNMETLFIQQLYATINKLDEPYSVDPRGSPHQPRIVIMCLILKIFLCKTYDEIEAYVKNNQALKELTGVDKMPTHSVIHNAMSKVSIKYIRKVIKRTIQRLNKKRNLAVDSSGFRTRTSSSWYDIRIGRKNQRKDNMKLHIVVDIDTGQILNAIVTDYKSNDNPKLKQLLKDIYNISFLFADSGYLSRKNCQIVKNKKGKPYILPKKNVRLKSKRSPAWREMIKEYNNNKKDWLKRYHARSYVESVFASIKKRYGSGLLSFKKLNKRKELLIKVLCYNIKELLYNREADRRKVNRWKYY